MIKILIICLLPILLNASKVLSYNIYDRTDRVDVMLTFDTPFEGVIKQKRTNKQIIIKLLDAEIESPKVKQLSSDFLHSLSIAPMDGYLKIIASVPNSVKLRASKTSDSYGLRLRFSIKASSKTTKTKDLLSNLPTKKDDTLSQNYYIVVGMLIIGIFILLFIKRKAIPKKEIKKQNSWLFNENQEQKETKQSPNTNIKNSASIRFEKNIDSSNSVIMLDFDQYSYLLLIGNGNILLDKFKDNKPQTQEDFETILQDRHKELDEFLNIKPQEKIDSSQEALQAYTKRAAASISYDV